MRYVQSCGGGGVRVLVRDCNNPAPANDGKECEREDWMHGGLDLWRLPM